ncbi:MAG TPA: hypothetical protein P5245_03325 [Candidatus Sumerlaeia bacterium]|nr:hypothetical protein [Candidatus Sumerlaeia bacterium]
MKKIVVLFFVMALALSVQAQNTYTWNVPTGAGDFQAAASWNPNRATPANTDILTVDGASLTGAVELNNVPTQTIGKLIITGNAYVALRPQSGACQLTVSGGAQALLVNAGSTLKITSNVAGAYLVLEINNASTGEIYGDVIFNSEAASLQNRIIAMQASGLKFKSGSTAAMAPTTTGAGGGFGGTSGAGLPASVNNGVIFESGSHYYQGGLKDGYFNGGTGSNPFALAAPNSCVIFESGSSYTSWCAIPATSGRTYANFYWGEYLAHRALGGGSPLVMLNDCVLLKSPGGIKPGTYIQGNMNISGQTGNWSIGGDFIIQNEGTSLIYDPAFTAARTWTISGNVDVQNAAQITPPTSSFLTVVHDGASSKTINWAGITLPNMTVNAAAGISLAGDVTISGLLTLEAGTITTNGKIITAKDTALPANGYVISALTRSIDATVLGNRLFPIGTTQSTPVEIDITAAGTGTGTIAASVKDGDHPNAADPAKTLDRYWTITPSGISGVTATLVFHYLDGDVTGGLEEANMIAAAWDGATWTSYPTTIDTVNNTATVTGITTFSDWTLIGAVSGVKDWKMY